MDLHSLLIDCAQKEGFPLAGTVDLSLAFSAKRSSSQEEHIQNHIDRFDGWIRAGYAGSMGYLERGRDRRADPKLVFPETQSIFCVAVPYHPKPAGSTDFAHGPRYARYLRSSDYHSEISARLERVMESARLQWRAPLGKSPPVGPDLSSLRWKVCVDTSAVLEKTWAALAGLGWIGKNSLLIHPQFGSYLFLGVVLVNQSTGREPSPLPSYCGRCTRCLDACPTGAFPEPRVLNSSQCISYWTLEKRGDLPLNKDEKIRIGAWVAGCDICQEVCPFNRKTTQAGLSGNPPSSADGAIGLNSWEDLLQETSSLYRERVKNSALSRVKPAQFSRNLAIALTNALQDAASCGNGENLRSLRPLVERRYEEEQDEVAKKEWAECLHSPYFIKAFENASTTGTEREPK